jgi:hypothetical protein
MKGTVAAVSVAAILGAAAAVVGTPASLALVVLLALLVAGIALFRSDMGLLQRLGLEEPPDLGAAITLGLLCIAIVTSSWNGLRAGAGLAVCDVFFALTAISFVVLVAHRRVRTVVPKWLLVPAYVLLVDVLVSTLADGNAGALVPGIRLVAAMLLTPLVIGYTAGNLRALPLIVECWLISATVNAGVASIDYLGGAHLGESLTGVLGITRQAGLTTQPNHLGFVCVFALPFFVARLLSTRDRRAQAAYLAGMGVALMGLLASGSRGGLVVGVFTLAAAPFFQSALRQRALRLVSLVVVLAAVAIVILPSNLSLVSLERLTGSSAAIAGVERSDTVRAVKREEAIDNFNASPLYGSGFNSIREAQNVYLQLLSAGGLIALLAWVAFALGGLAAALRFSRSPGLPTSLRTIGGAVAGTFAAWLLLGAVENQLYDRYLFVPCGIFVTCLIYQLAEPALAPACSYRRSILAT